VGVRGFAVGKEGLANAGVGAVDEADFGPDGFVKAELVFDKLGLGMVGRFDGCLNDGLDASKSSLSESCSVTGIG
jgi:hypothetical protein